MKPFTKDILVEKLELAGSSFEGCDMAAMNRRLLQPGERIRVLVVDDSVVIRRLVTHALEQDPEIEVVGAAANGSIALQRIPQFNPDVLTLDIEMPEMDGLETLRHLRRDYPHLRVIMFSTLTERGAAVTLEALTLGADDYVTKASNEGSLDRSMTRLREELIPKIKQFFHSACAKSRRGIGREPAQRPRRPHSGRERRACQSTCREPKVVVIGVSTGGPTALGAILPQLAGRVSIADPGCAAHAASLHPVSCRASSLLLPAAESKRRARATGGGRQDI